MQKYNIDCLAYVAGVYADEKYWVSNWRYNGLFSINNNDEIQFVGRFEKYPVDLKGIHSCVKKHGKNLYFFPQKGRFINIYNMEQKQFSFLEIKPWSEYKMVSVIDVFEDETGFWLFPRYYELPIVKIDFEGNILSEYFINETKNISLSNNNIMTLSVCYGPANKIYLPIYNSNRIVEIDLANGDEKIWKLNSQYEFQTISYKDGYFWLSSGWDIILFNEFFEEIERFAGIVECNQENEQKVAQKVAQILINEKYAYIIPVWYSRLLRIDIKTKNVDMISIDLEKTSFVNDTIKKWRTFRGGYLIGEEVRIYPVSLDSEIIICKDNIKYKKVIITHEFAPKMDFNKNKYYMEQSSDDLKILMNMLLEL